MKNPFSFLRGKSAASRRKPVASGAVKFGHAIALTGATDKSVLVRLCQGLG